MVGEVGATAVIPELDFLLVLCSLRLVVGLVISECGVSPLPSVSLHHDLIKLLSCHFESAIARGLTHRRHLLVLCLNLLLGAIHGLRELVGNMPSLATRDPGVTLAPSLNSRDIILGYLQQF